METIEFYVDGNIMESCPVQMLDRKLSEYKKRFRDTGLPVIHERLSGCTGYILFGCPVKQKASFVVWKNYTGYKDISGKKLYVDDFVSMLSRESGHNKVENAQICKDYKTDEAGNPKFYVRYFRDNNINCPVDVDIKESDYEHFIKIADVTEKFKKQ